AHWRGAVTIQSAATATTRYAVPGCLRTRHDDPRTPTRAAPRVADDPGSAATPSQTAPPIAEPTRYAPAPPLSHVLPAPLCAAAPPATLTRATPASAPPIPQPLTARAVVSVAAGAHLRHREDPCPCREWVLQDRARRTETPDDRESTDHQTWPNAGRHVWARRQTGPTNRERRHPCMTNRNPVQARP